jgi:hypothetical protein
MILIFIIINFIVSAISDIILNLLSRNHFSQKNNLKIILSLKPYFKNKTMIQSSIYAGITIVFALLMTMLISKTITGIIVPTNNYELFKFILVAFPLGYIIDILINNWKVFGNGLDLYYKVAGAGFWGGLSFVFSIIISYIIQNLLLIK